MTACLPCRGARLERALKDIDDLTKPIREGERFFMATTSLRTRKLDIIGWKGPKAALQAIEDAAKSFRER
jgi:inorganic pyrophosphatase